MKKILILLILFLGIFSVDFCFGEDFTIMPTISVDPTFPAPGQSVTITVGAQLYLPSGGSVNEVRIRINYGNDPTNTDDWNGVPRFRYPESGSLVDEKFVTSYDDADIHTIAIEICYKNGSAGSWEHLDENPSAPGKYCKTSYKTINESTTPFCGDGGVNQATEECDKKSFNGKTCIDYGFNQEGSLTCTADCKIDSSSCTNKPAEPEIPKKYPNALLWENILEFLEYFLIYLFRIVSVCAVLVILIGAFIMVTSAGDPSRVEKGRKTVIWAIIGFAVTMTVNGIIALVKALFGAK